MAKEAVGELSDAQAVMLTAELTQLVGPIVTTAAVVGWSPGLVLEPNTTNMYNKNRVFDGTCTALPLDCAVTLPSTACQPISN